jgi:Ser/Thr protein kinase RdoA (MazF antagonist)
MHFLSEYHKVFPLSPQEINFLPWAYRFFILNYVIREGSKFFRTDIAEQFRHDAATLYLPQLNSIDFSVLQQIRT